MKFYRHMPITAYVCFLFMNYISFLLIFNSSASAAEIILKDVERIDHDTVLLKFNDGSKSMHKLSTGEKVADGKFRKEEPEPETTLNYLLKSFGNNLHSQDISKAEAKALLKSEKIATVTIKNSKIFSLQLYNAKNLNLLKATDLKLTQNLEDLKSRSSHSSEIELFFSDYGKYILLRLFDPLLYVLDANSLKVIAKVEEDSVGIPRFALNDERLILKGGCACEGQDNRTLIVLSVRDPELRLELNHANYFSNAIQDFHIDNEFMWAVNEKEIITWNLKTLKLHKRIRHNSCGDPNVFRTILMNDSSDEPESIYLKDKGTAFVSCVNHAHLKLYKFSKAQFTLVLDKTMDPIFKAFVLPGKVIATNKHGMFTIIPFSMR